MKAKTEFDKSSIGFVAGDILTFLGGCEGEVSLNKVCEALGHTNRTIYAAVGWLAREDKVNLRTEKSRTLVSIC